MSRSALPSGLRSSLRSIAGAAGVIFVLLAAIFLSDVCTLRDLQARRKVSECAGNLKQGGPSCIEVYSKDHDGAFPGSLNDLHPRYVSDLRIFLCPVANHEVGAVSEIQAWSDYEYTRPRGMTYGADRAHTTAVCVDRHDTHEARGSERPQHALRGRARRVRP